MEFILGRKGREGGRKRDFLGEEVVGTRRERSREREKRGGPLDREHGGPRTKPGCKETDKKKRSFN